MKLPVTLVLAPLLLFACQSEEASTDRTGRGATTQETNAAAGGGSGTATGTIPPGGTGTGTAATGTGSAGTGTVGGGANTGPNGAPETPPCGDPCRDVPQCEFLCPEGTVNPTDKNGCVHTCKCVPAPSTVADGGVSPELKLFTTCGDPVCGIRPHGDPAIPACRRGQAPGAACSAAGTKCDPCPGCDAASGCNQYLVCASQDPQGGPGGCPISRRSYKRDIRYLGDSELARYEAALLHMKLATWRYKHDPARARLGFIIDDVDGADGSVAIEGGERVDLYGYTSLAVATLQRQAKQIAELRRELAALKRQVSR
jgi:hypothetical protein